MPDYAEVHSTASSLEEARKISSAVLKSHLVACVQIFSPIRSLYWWRGNLEQSEEYFLKMKTTRDRFEEVVAIIRANHSYEVPEIVLVPILDGSRDYLEWISEETRESGEPA